MINKSADHMKGRTISLFYLSGPHPVNESFVRTPPSNVTLRSNINPLDFEDFSRPKEFGRSWRRKKRVADTVFQTLSMPRTIPVLKRCDIIHTNGGIVPLSPVPWVASIENPSGFYGFDDRWHQKERRRRRLAKILLERRCRALLPYSKASKSQMTLSLADWAEAIDEKMVILYPAIDEYMVSPLEEHEVDSRDTKPVRFLFVGDRFFDKGGRDVLRAFEHVREIAPCQLTLVTSAPAHHLQEYEAYKKRILSVPEVNLTPTGMRRRELMRLFRESDVFVFPSYMDQVPFVLLEAMAAGLALIGSNSYAIPEMVLENQNGFNVDSPCLAFPANELRTRESVAEYRRNVLEEHLFDDVVDKLIKIMTRYAVSRELISRCGIESRKMVTEGRFSVKFRNATLSRVYESAVSGEKMSPSHLT